MHELYTEKHEENHENPLVSYDYYLTYFNQNFNFSFGYPKSDTCSTCDQLEVQLNASSDSAVQSSIRLGVHNCTMCVCIAGLKRLLEEE